MPTGSVGTCCCSGSGYPCLDTQCPGKVWPATLTATVTSSGDTSNCCGFSGPTSFSLTFSSSINDGHHTGPGWQGSLELGCTCTLTLYLICEGGTGGNFFLDVQLSNDTGSGGCGSCQNFFANFATESSFACTPYHSVWSFPLNGPSCFCNLSIDITE